MIQIAVRRIAFAAAVLAWMSTVNAADAKHAELRSLLKLPAAQLSIGYDISSREDFASVDPSPEARRARQLKRIQELEATLKSDARNAPLWLELSELHYATDAPDKSTNSAKRAEVLLREQLARNATNATALTHLGRALQMLNQSADAEKPLRQAVELAPRDSQSWLALAEYYVGQSFRILRGTNAAHADLHALMSAPNAETIPIERRTEARQMLDEAEDCFDKAVEAAPRDFNALKGRFVFRIFTQNMVAAVVEGERSAQERFMGALLQPEGVAQLRQLGSFQTNNPRLIAMVAFMEATCNALQHGGPKEDPTEGGIWKIVDPQVRDSVRDALRRLESVSTLPDSAAAIPALIEAASLEVTIVGDVASAEQRLRNAVKLDPKAETAWNMLVGVLAVQDAWPTVVTVSEERIKAVDSAEARFHIAKAFEKLNKPAEAEAAIRAGLRNAPDDYALNLSLVVLLLKHHLAEADQEEARKILDRLKNEQLSGLPVEKQRELEFVHGIVLALAGDLKAAKDHFNFVLSNEAAHEEARQALELLGQ